MNYKPDYRYIPPITWESLTPFYDFFCSVGGLGQRFKKKVLNSVYLQDRMRVADIGCGTGVFLKIAKQKYPRVEFIGVDPDSQALTIANQRLVRAKILAELKKGFAESLPLPDQSQDVCFSTLAFHHMPDDIKKRAVEEIYRVLKPGGVVIIADFGPYSRFPISWILPVFENIEYLRGNLNGLIPAYLRETGFVKVETIDKYLRAIEILKAEKPT